MSFDERYQLLELAEDAGVKTFIAREISTGKKVTAFLFVGEHAQLQAELLNQLRTADRLQLPDLIEIGDNRGTFYVIMEPQISFAELKAQAAQLKFSTPAHAENKPGEFSKVGIWRVPSSLQPAPSHAEKPLGESAIFEQKPRSAQTSAAPESFTQMYQTPAAPIGEAVPEPPEVTPEPLVAPPSVNHAPGSFTQIFQAPAAPIGEAVPKPPEVTLEPLVAPPSVNHAPGSFTQIFQAPAAPIGEAVPKPPEVKPEPLVAPPPENHAPGSFTQIFQAPAAPIGEAVPEPPEVKPEPLVAPPQTHADPGEFTRMFQAPAPPIGEPKEGTPKAEPGRSAPGSFTQMFQAAAPPIGEPSSKAPKAPPAKSAPGEFTRFFNAQSPTPAAPALPSRPEAQGSFDRIFGSGDRVTSPPSTVTGIFNQSSSIPAAKPEQTGSAVAPAPPPAFAPSGGEFSRIFGETSLEIPTLGPMQAPRAPSTQPPVNAPGEYTRMFSASSLQQEPIIAPPPAPATAPQVPAPATQSSKLVPVLIGVIVLLIAAVAVILVLMKK
jgi:hypothetical protein